jgi:hypothetical protein
MKLAFNALSVCCPTRSDSRALRARESGHGRMEIPPGARIFCPFQPAFLVIYWFSLVCRVAGLVRGNLVQPDLLPHFLGLLTIVYLFTIRYICILIYTLFFSDVLLPMGKWELPPFMCKSFIRPDPLSGCATRQKGSALNVCEPPHA